MKIEHAVKYNKRRVPVVWKGAEDSQVYPDMTVHNRVFLRRQDDFEANFELLIDALDTDVLRGPELTAAEGWLAISRSMEPQSTELHDDCIIFSRATVSRIQGAIYSDITVVFVMMMGLLAFAFHLE